MKNFIIIFLVLFILLGGNITFVFTNNYPKFSMSVELILFLILINVSFLLSCAVIDNKRKFLQSLRRTEDVPYIDAFARALPVVIFSLFTAVAFPYAFYCVRTHQEIFSMQTMQNIMMIAENFFKSMLSF